MMDTNTLTAKMEEEMLEVISGGNGIDEPNVEKIQSPFIEEEKYKPIGHSGAPAPQDF